MKVILEDELPYVSADVLKEGLVLTHFSYEVYYGGRLPMKITREYVTDTVVNVGNAMYTKEDKFRVVQYKVVDISGVYDIETPRDYAMFEPDTFFCASGFFIQPDFKTRIEQEFIGGIQRLAEHKRAAMAFDLRNLDNFSNDFETKFLSE